MKFKIYLFFIFIFILIIFYFILFLFLILYNFQCPLIIFEYLLDIYQLWLLLFYYFYCYYFLNFVFLFCTCLQTNKMLFFMLQCIASCACSHTNCTHNNLSSHAPSVNAFIHCLLCQTHKLIRSWTLSSSFVWLTPNTGPVSLARWGAVSSNTSYSCCRTLTPSDLRPCDPFQLANVSRTKIALCASYRSSSAPAAALASAIKELQTLLQKFVW